MIDAPLADTFIRCVYALLYDKSQLSYQELLTAVLNRCTALGFQPDPITVIKDYELAAISAVKTVFGHHVNCHGCFYHLTQNTWRKIQALGLVTTHRSDERAKLFCGMLDGLAFFPIADVPAGMAYLKENVPDAFEPLLRYFDGKYVSGMFRSVQGPPGPNGAIYPVGIRRIFAFLPTRSMECS